MPTVKVNASSSYDVIIGKKLLEESGKLISKVISPCKAAIISDDKVFSLYGNSVKTSLEKDGFCVSEFIFPNGEHSKNLSTFAKILEFLAQNHLCRTDIIIALGGGVVGDMAGFCAATYLRGIRFVQIPTTILAACDSSVGGKTAVDLEAGKNLAGAFHQPSLVICDTDTFDTLDERQVSCGYAEIIKYGMIRDSRLFDALSKKISDIQAVITRCVEIKRDIVEKDEKENGERKLLNFGHTLGHAIEKHSGFGLTHGDAVAVGMVMICEIAEKLGLCEGVLQKLKLLCKDYGLPCEYTAPKNDLISIARGDKKADGESVTLVMPVKIGECVLKKVSFAEFSKMLDLIL